MPNYDIPEKGLRFSCIDGCSRCCRGDGYVWVSENEIAEIAALLKVDRELFKREYTVRRNDKHILKDRRNITECIFLTEEGKCSVYDARPIQCRIYPFWPRIILDKELFNYEYLQCPGLGEGDFVPRDRILKMLTEGEKVFGDQDNFYNGT